MLKELPRALEVASNVVVPVLVILFAGHAVATINLGISLSKKWYSIILDVLKISVVHSILIFGMYTSPIWITYIVRHSY